MLSILFLSLFVITFILLIYSIQKYKEIQKKYELLRDRKFDGDALYFKSRYASMGETVGNIAHQWKQPLNAIGSIQNSIKAALLFQGEISKEKLLNSVETSFKLIQHLAETIDTFYSFLSQKNNTKMSFKVADELEKVKKITEYSFQNSNILLQFGVEVNPIIQGNPNEFTHAMLNIILNAKDAFDDTSIPSPFIKIDVVERQSICLISIVDNAGGIKIDPVEMVFDLHISTKTSGSGLGLFMTKNIIEKRFGGKISVTNQNNGACFSIELPYAEYAEDSSSIISFDEKLTLERINTLSHKIIELEEVEKALKMWADIFKHARWGIAIYVEESQCFEVSNSAFESLYGYTSKEIKKRTLADFFTPETLPFFLVVQAEALKQGYAVLEAVHQRKDGTVFPVSIELIVVKDEMEKVLYIIANIWDLTEEKEVANALQKSEEAFRAMVENSPDVIMRYDRECRRTYINPLGLILMGKSEKELLGKTPREFSPLPDIKEFEEAFYRVVNEAIEVKIEGEFNTSDGEKRWGEQRIVPELNSQGKVISVLVIGRDITELRKANENLLLKDFALDNIQESVFLLDEDSKFHYVNESAYHTLGYTKEELLEIGVVDLDPNISMPIWKEHWEDIKKNKTTLMITEHTKKDGTTFPIEVSSNYFEYHGVGYSLAVSRDISERKVAEEKLLLVNTALNTTSEAVYITDETFSIIYVNDGACKMLGYTKEELTSMKVYEIDALYSLDNLSTLQEDKQSKLQMFFETKHRRKDETIIDVEIAGSSFSFHDKIVYLSVVKDITAKKDMEKNLFLLETAINHANDALYIVGDSRSILYVSDTSCKMLGYTHNEFLSMKVEDIDPYMSIEAIDAVKDEVYASSATTFQTKHRTKEGKILDVEITVTKFVYNNENLRLSVVKDITELKRDKETIIELNKTLEQKVMTRTRELQKAVKFNKSIIQAIPDMLFEISKEGVYLNIWARDEKLLAAQKELLLGKSFRDMLPPEAATVSLKTMDEVDRYGSSLGNSYKLDFPDGEHWFELHTTKKEPDGTYLALVREITERKKAKDALIELNATLEEKVKERTSELQRAFEFNEDIINTLPDLLFEMDESGNYLNIWAQNKELLAQQKEALLGSNIYDVLSKQAADTIIKAFKEANISKLSIGKHIEIDLSEGKKWFELSVSKKSDGNYLILSREVLGR
jgi:PAS domain S-box-containing protein